MATAGYISAADLKAYIGLTGSGQDTNISNAILGDRDWET